MTNPKDTDDVITSADDQPETLIDEQLEDVDGGYLKITMTNAEVVGGAGVSPFAGGNTVSGRPTADVIDYQDGHDLILRKRPGR